jgi:competence protein ComEC
MKTMKETRVISGWLAFSVIVVMVLLTAWLVVMAGQADSDRLRVSFLDVGQGDATLIETPSGNQVLIDGGAANRVSQPLARALPFYDRSLDMVIASHGDGDHIGGLVAVLKRFDVARIAPPLSSSVSAVYSAFVAATEAEVSQGASVEKLERGSVVDLGDGAYLVVFFPRAEHRPAESNAGSFIIKLIYGDTSWLLTGDSPRAIEEYLAVSDGKALAADVLKVGHHGSDTSSSRIFLSAVSPATAVISAGADNPYGHPHQSVLDSLDALGIEVLCTCETGTITFTSDGREIMLQR